MTNSKLETSSKKKLDRLLELCNNYGHKSKGIFRIEHDEIKHLKAEIEQDLEYSSKMKSLIPDLTFEHWNLIKEKAEKWDNIQPKEKPMPPAREVSYEEMLIEIINGYPELKNMKAIVERLKKRKEELLKEDNEELEFTRKQFPNWTEEEIQSTHKIENYALSLIEELQKILDHPNEDGEGDKDG